MLHIAYNGIQDMDCHVSTMKMLLFHEVSFMAPSINQRRRLDNLNTLLQPVDWPHRHWIAHSVAYVQFVEGNIDRCIEVYIKIQTSTDLAEVGIITPTSIVKCAKSKSKYDGNRTIRRISCKKPVPYVLAPTACGAATYFGKTNSE